MASNISSNAFLSFICLIQRVFYVSFFNISHPTRFFMRTKFQFWQWWTAWWECFFLSIKCVVFLYQPVISAWWTRWWTVCGNLTGLFHLRTSSKRCNFTQDTISNLSSAIKRKVGRPRHKPSPEIPVEKIKYLIRGTKFGKDGTREPEQNWSSAGEILINYAFL